MENQNPIPTPLPQPTQEQSKPKISNKIWAIIILAIIAGILSWVYFQRQPKVDLSPIVMHQKETKPEIKSELKTYSNTEYGFEFEYPQNLNFDPNSTKDFGLIITKTNISFDDWLKQAKKYDADTKQSNIYTPITVGGIGGVSVHYAEQTTLGDEVYFIKDSRLYNFVFAKVDPSTAKQILSSFKFTTPETSEWKTYKNEEYGFEFQYPQDWIVELTDTGVVIHLIKQVEWPSIDIRITSKNVTELSSEVKKQVDDFLQQDISQTNINFASIKAIAIDHGTAIGGSNRNIVFEHNGRGYWISYGIGTETDAKILSTFKFTK